MFCRFCNHELSFEFIDLVNSPPSNSYLTPQQLNEPEVFFPLRLFVCPNCFLVQIDEYKKSSEIFNNNYAYFSSYSSSWVQHAKNYVEIITDKLFLNEKSNVLEIASNDGYLLQFFKQKNIPCIGIEPSSNTAEEARKKGIETISAFFTDDFAVKLGKKFDLIVGNNVFAHVPDINDFVSGLKRALKPNGTITLEFPHLLQLIIQTQFDTIYHEHFSYYSLLTANKIFHFHELEIYDVDELSTHGGSLRLYIKHKDDRTKELSKNIDSVLKKELEMRLNELDGYNGFEEKVNGLKNELISFLIARKKEGKKIIAYGAAAKGNTFLNYCGIKKDLISFIVDLSPSKKGKYMPASHIPIVDQSEILKFMPDYVIILPWNIKEEIMSQLNYIKDWGGQFIIAVPDFKIVKY